MSGSYNLTTSIIETHVEVKVVGDSKQLSQLLALLEDNQDCDCLMPVYEGLLKRAKNTENKQNWAKAKPLKMYPGCIEQIAGIDEEGVLSFKLSARSTWVKSDYNLAADVCRLIDEALPGLSANMYFECDYVHGPSYTIAMARWGKRINDFWPRYVLVIPKRDFKLETNDFAELRKAISCEIGVSIESLTTIESCVALFEHDLSGIVCGERIIP